MTTTVGHDGEVFLRNPKTNEFVSSIGLIGGTKEKPLPIPHLGQGFALQEDNVTVEFNIPPATNSQAFISSISSALSEIRRRAFALGLEVAIDSSAEFPSSELEHPNARTAGCTVDYNAWTMLENSRPDLSKTNLRTSGGHIHIGTNAKPFAVIRACDYFLGIASVVLDKDHQRRKLYGSAGSFRFTPWGVEYRSLSNFWLKDPTLMSWVFDATLGAVREASRSGIDTTFMMNHSGSIQNIINEGKVDLAYRFIKDHGIKIPNVFF